MIYQFKKMTSPVKAEEVTPASSAVPVAKFQRTGKRQNTAPEQTNTNSQKTESIITQQIKQIPITDKPRVISRTSKLEKTQSVLSNKSQETQKRNLIKSKSPKQLPQIVQSQEPKSLIPKVQKPKANNLKQAANNQTEIVQSIVSKNSAVIFYTISRLRKNIISSIFLKLSQNKKEQRIKLESQARLLSLRASQIPLKFQLNFFHQFLWKLKIIYGKKKQQESKAEIQMHSSNFKKAKQFLFNILSILNKQKLKESLNLLKHNQFKKTNAARAVPTLTDFYQRRKMKQAFRWIKQGSNLMSLRRKHLLGAISNANLFCQKELNKKAFIKLIQWAFGQATVFKKQSLIQEKSKNTIISPQNVGKNIKQWTSKVQKIHSQKQNHQRQINVLESKLKNVKKEQQSQKKGLQKDLEKLKSDNKKYQKQVQEKKQVNKSLKNQENYSKNEKDQMNIASDDRTANEQFSKISRIYFTINRSQGQDLNPLLSLVVQENKNNKPIIQQWQLILQKSLIQRQINSYENAIVGESGLIKQQNSIVKLVLEENEMLKNMIRNYTKQRYLWSEVQKFVSSML